MDVVTELTARITGYIGLLQDALTLLPAEQLGVIGRKTPRLLYLDLLNPSLTAPNGALIQNVATYPQWRASALDLAAPGWHKAAAQLPPDELGPFSTQAADLLATLLRNKKSLIPKLEERAESLKRLPKVDAFPPPEHWRYAVRALLYEQPLLRKTIADQLAYKPVLVQKAGEVLQARDGLTSEQEARLLTDDTFRDDTLHLGECALPFEAILRRELAEIIARRAARDTDKDPSVGRGYSPDAFQCADNLKLLGLAFSGGGIRSATFNLGILQGLASKGWLEQVDYLSTVSGGGYLGAWLSAWIKRSGSVAKVIARLCPDLAPEPLAEEVRPIRWLRMYSNYLAPSPTFLSADSWTMGLTWLRNTVLNQLIIVLLLGAVLAFGALLRQWWEGVFWSNPLAATISGLLIGAGIAGGLGMSMYSIKHKWPAARSISSLVYITILLGIVGAFLLSALMISHQPPTSFSGYVALWPTAAWVAGTLLGVLVLVAILGYYARCFYSVDDTEEERLGRKIKAWVMISICSILAAVLGVVALSLTWEALFHLFRHDPIVRHAELTESVKLASFSQPHSATLYAQLKHPTTKVSTDTTLYPSLAFILGLPLVLEALAVTVIARMALLGRRFPDERREWWGRMGSYINLLAVLWIVVTSSILLGPYLFKFVGNQLSTWLAATGWTALVLGALQRAYSARTPAQPDQPGAASWLDAVLGLGPYAFGLALLVLVSNVVTLLLNTDWGSWASGLSPEGKASILMLGLALLTVLLAWRVDVNEFSLHHFYRNRLTRAYLGASRRRSERNRTANPFTHFDRRDDLALCTLRRNDPLVTKTPSYDGPYLIVNATLNATSLSADDLDRQDRKAESFVFTPHYCGFDITRVRPLNPNNPITDFGYRPTRHYAYPDSGGPALGTAIAISGAAANPNRGYSSSPASAFLLTLFNIRLGWWMGNPWHEDTWQNSGPHLGLLYLLSDLFGRSSTKDRFVNLSDGGHFDNMGLYELVRRRCRYIIVGDGEEDHLFTCEGLANAIRRCRTDFGVEIDIDVTPITDRKDRLSRSHYAVGTLNYPEDPPNQPSGFLLYLKTSLTGEEPTDVREYAEKNLAFPHQSTADQFFNESQFESYRRLGLHVIDELATRNKISLPASGSLQHIFEQLLQTWNADRKAPT
ncbi:patatin-like phospholipase family protein [Hymenobacter cavernae]|uniref:PNPLA domain-containing protein n=1 Tax=Hymenobacter cavernae TaxID=2044852 RepID=A0ABQ1TXZ7_9BACT|nr:patatin-like phospholipase family protein [Hymenobacter cavernae]GGF04827.1 hypothetical protein GCM10011383_14960 [Hymenobacter cavernae]